MKQPWALMITVVPESVPHARSDVGMESESPSPGVHAMVCQQQPSPD